MAVTMVESMKLEGTQPLKVISDSMYHFNAIAEQLGKEGYTVQWTFRIDQGKVDIVLSGTRKSEQEIIDAETGTANTIYPHPR